MSSHYLLDCKCAIQFQRTVYMACYSSLDTKRERRRRLNTTLRDLSFRNFLCRAHVVKKHDGWK